MTMSESKKDDFIKFKGKMLRLTCEPFVSGTRDDEWYACNALDNEGNEYFVRWDVLPLWKELKDKAFKTGEVDSLLEDESNACNWDDYKISSPYEAEIAE